MPSTMVVANLNTYLPGAKGFLDYNPVGFAITAGSLTPDLTASQDVSLFDEGSEIRWVVEGNRLSVLTELTHIKIDDTVLAMTGSPEFDGGLGPNGTTGVSFEHMNLVIGNSYSVELLFGEPEPIPPNITTTTSFNNTEGQILSIALTADKPISTWSIIGGTDQSDFEISGSTLRWVGNGVQSYSSPADSDTNNTYVVQIRATDEDTLTDEITITVTVLELIVSVFDIVLKNPGSAFNILLSTDTNEVTVYIGSSWLTRYVGTVEESILYKGAETLL